MFIYTVPDCMFNAAAPSRASPSPPRRTYYTWEVPAACNADGKRSASAACAAPWREGKAAPGGASHCRVSVSARNANESAATANAGRVIFQTLSASGAAAFDLIEGPDAYKLVTDAPGMSAEDIIIDVHEQVLTVEGHKPHATQAAAQNQQQHNQQHQQGEKHWEMLSSKESLSNSDDEDGSVEEVEDEEDARIRHPGMPSPSSPSKPAAAPVPPIKRSSTDGASTSAPAAPAESEQRVLFAERRNSTFKRSFKLPSNVLADNISASLDKGVLTVHVPKKPIVPKPQPTRIPVKLVA